MNELYWLTKFTAIHTVFILILVLSIIILSVSTIIYFQYCDAVTNSEKWNKKLAKRISLLSLFFIFIGLLGIIFIPTTKEAFTIWGLGGTTDYLKENSSVKRFPDECINTLDKWVDSVNQDSIENKK